MTRQSAGNTKINIYFNERVLDALRKLALAKGTTYSELIREACAHYVLKEGPKIVTDIKAIRELAR